MRRIELVFLMAATLSWAALDTVHFLRWADVQSLVTGFTGPDKLRDFKDAEDWDSWIRQHDGAIRDRVDHGIEDSISELILFGTSFPAPPKLAAAPEAVNAAGDLTTAARARVAAFIQALDELDSDRCRMALDYLRRRRVTEEELDAFLSGNLRRYALEQVALQKKQVRGEAGLPSETSLLINFGVDDTLRALKASGGLPLRIRRIAVIGPGLDLAGEPGVYDFSAPQSIQPFAVLESVLRLGNAQASEVQLTALDVNPFVLSHLRSSLSKARSGQRYLLQIARPSASGWNSAVVSYWQRFGDTIGTPAATVAVTPPGLDSRMIALKAQIAARISVEDVDIVTQTLETAAGQGFDLVIATNLFPYYNRADQALALTSITRMMASGGILVANGITPVSRIAEFEDLGPHHAAYTDAGGGDDLLTYRRR